MSPSSDQAPPACERPGLVLGTAVAKTVGFALKLVESIRAELEDKGVSPSDRRDWPVARNAPALLP